MKGYKVKYAEPLYKVLNITRQVFNTFIGHKEVRQ